jgi:hypothetical protein
MRVRGMEQELTEFAPLPCEAGGPGPRLTATRRRDCLASLMRVLFHAGGDQSRDVVTAVVADVVV